MLRLVPWFLVLSSAFGCQDLYKAERPYVVYSQKAEFFDPIINESETAEKPVTLSDASYPIDVKLYKDGRFHYFLKRLGDGWGTWKHEDGHLSLYAERKIFVMNFAIRSLDQKNPEAIALEFSDRFGPKHLKMDTRR